MKTKLPPYLASSYSEDKRKRRRQHRRAAKNLMGQRTMLGNRSSAFYDVAQWHLQQARYLGR